MTATLSDHDLTTLVDAAARGVAASAAAWHGGTPWDEMDAMTQNNVREAALPFIFHGTKALADLGYRKPRMVTTAEELRALPEGAVVIDSSGDVSQLRSGEWCGYETAPLPSSFMARYLPATVIHEGD
jgi:hypothetical protein